MKLWTVAAAVMFGIVTGCGGDATGDRVEAILALTGDPAAGDPLFQATCADCHNVDASGGTGPGLVGQADSELMATQILDGGATMPPQADLLTDQEIADIIAWIQSL